MVKKLLVYALAYQQALPDPATIRRLNAEQEKLRKELEETAQRANQQAQLNIQP